MPPIIKEALVAGSNYTKSYGVCVFVVKHNGSRALPVGEQGEPGDWIVKTTLTPDHVNGDIKVAGVTLFKTNRERLKFVQQTKIGKVLPQDVDNAVD